MDKSADAFRTISEVAEHLETPAHVLRFWESRFPQIRPVKRAGGRRYYRPSDVSLLTGIKRLLHDQGMTIRGVQKILREQGVRHVAGLSGDHLVYEQTGEMGGDTGDASAHQLTTDLRGDFGDETAVVQPVTTPRRNVVVPLLPESAQNTGDSGAQPTTPAGNGPVAEPAQGALLLTPAPAQDARAPDLTAEMRQATPVPDTQRDAVSDSDWADAALEIASSAVPHPPALQHRTVPDEPPHGDNFEDEDFDTVPVTPVVSRIRALPPQVSAGVVGAELLGVVARLQSLRDRMANAAQSGRS